MLINVIDMNFHLKIYLNNVNYTFISIIYQVNYLGVFVGQTVDLLKMKN